MSRIQNPPSSTINCSGEWSVTQTVWFRDVD